MMLKFKKGTKLLQKQDCFAACFQSDIMEGIVALPSTARSASSGICSGANSTPMNVAFHWNGFSCVAPGAKLNTFELFNIATFLRGFPSTATKVLSHWQILSFIDCTTPLPQIPACAEAQFAPLALPTQP